MDTITYFVFIAVGLIILHKYIIFLRDQRKITFRSDSRDSIMHMVHRLLNSGRLIDRRIGNTAPWIMSVPYVSILGSKTPRKVIALQAGLHGLEYFSIEVLLKFLMTIDEDYLINQEIQIIAFPIVNYWGFKEYKRTNKNGVDLARNYRSYSSPLKNVPEYLFVKGHRMKPWIKQITILMSKTWYNRGYGYVESELYELSQEYSGLLGKHQDICFYDFHTGNTSDVTTLWRHEFDTRKNIPVHLADAFIYHNTSRKKIEFGPIDYRTYGGLYEGLAYEHQKKHKNINAYTVELSVMNNYTNAKYTRRYFFGTVFEPYSNIRKEKLQEQLEIITDIIAAEITTESTLLLPVAS